MSQLTAIRLLDADEPSTPLLEAVQDLAEGRPNQSTYQVDPTSFRQVPNSPFAYWVSENIRRLFKELPPFEIDGRTANVGLQTSDDFRFIRAVWECPKNNLNSIWKLLAKGGEYSTFYSDVHLMVIWGNNGEMVKSWVASRYNNWSKHVQNINFYFCPGLTWTEATTKELSARVIPEDCIFSTSGPGAFMMKSSIFPVIALFHSKITSLLIKIQLGLAAEGRKHYSVGIINRIPFPVLEENSKKILGDSAKFSWSLKRKTDTVNLTSHAFYAPALSPGQFDSRRKNSNPSRVLS